MIAYETLLVEQHGGVAELVLNRPQQRNALNTMMCIELVAAINALRDDASINCVVIRANGPVFCAGADLKERQAMTNDEVRVRRIKGFAAYDAIEKIGKPCIALVQGPAVGSGGEIAMACDFIVATEAASFKTPEALWGTVGATQRLPRVVGMQLAKDMAFTGRILSSAEALNARLISRLIDGATALTTVRKMAQQISAAPALAIRLAKHCIDRGSETDQVGALAIELLAIEEVLNQSDWGRSIASFSKTAGNLEEKHG